MESLDTNFHQALDTIDSRPTVTLHDCKKQGDEGDQKNRMGGT